MYVKFFTNFKHKTPLKMCNDAFYRNHFHDNETTVGSVMASNWPKLAEFNIKQKFVILNL